MAMCLTFRLAIPLILLISLAASDDVSFIYNGFRSANLSLDGIAEFSSNGLLKLTNETKSKRAHAFYPQPVNFKNTTNGSVSSFSTTFVFAIASGYQNLTGHGMAFVISPTKSFPGAFAAQYLGLFNDSNNGNPRNHVFAVEFDTIPNAQFNDINGDHVGIDINGLNSRASFPAGYYEDGSRQFRNLSLTMTAGQRIQVWIEYHGIQKRMDGMTEFIAEIVSLGRLRHRNLVQLLGYCRRKGELLLIYDYMPNGSLDKYLYDQSNLTLNWRQRFKVIKGVASGLFYLHEGWEQVVIHRDVKASNVLLDGELNGRLGDFGLARLYDHETEPHTTHVVGTLGYLAPELTRTGKATPCTDVFAFGAFLLEVACGRRPISQSRTEAVILVDWVYSCWKKGDILEAKDRNMGSDYVAEEVELVLKLGLICSHSEPEARPSMRHVVQILEGDAPFLEISSLCISSCGLTFSHREGFDDFSMTNTNSTNKGFPHSSSSVPASILSGGR
ncbi:L-type lectin-domain containing receptor kinase IV.1 [Hibiscus syriacus]|uniref:non-specific serine/threonine protein kinase n=1 Tax=Hibiscus syriacus TaxID=106335 RepID=A0A6A2ZZD4_HIBSY|nr:L-type lectin-domain containing receptor kinase IV.1 [Hibiscus syriacus]